MRGLGSHRAERKSYNKRGEETAKRDRWRMRGRSGRETRREEQMIRSGGRPRQKDRSELFNLIFPKVPDISMHHELVLPPKTGCVLETTGSNQ